MPQLAMRMYNTLGRGVNPFDPPSAYIETTNFAKFLAWCEKFEAEGWLSEADHDGHVNMLRAMSKKRQAELSKPFDPTPQQVADARANQASGKGLKPFPKPVRDYRGTEMPSTPWVQVGPGKGPATPGVSTKRFPHLGGKSGPQARGE